MQWFYVELYVRLELNKAHIFLCIDIFDGSIRNILRNEVEQLDTVLDWTNTFQWMNAPE